MAVTSSSAQKTMNSILSAVLGSQHREEHLSMIKVLVVEMPGHQEPRLTSSQKACWKKLAQ